MKRRAPLFLVLGLALVVRTWLVCVLKWNSPNGDEAVAGLMAKHIAEGRDYPLFFYGQSYFGALEPYLNALLYRLVGFLPNLIFVLPVLFGAVTVWLEFKLAQEFGRDDVALMSALVLSLAPGALLDGTLSAAGGFGLALVLELSATVLFLRIYCADRINEGFFLCFSAISGMLFWVWQIYIPIFLVLILLLLASQPRVDSKLALSGGALFVAASSPLWFYNLTHGAATFVEIFDKFAAADTTSGPLEFAKSFVGNRLWNLAGYVQSWLSSIGGGGLVLLVAIMLGMPLAFVAFRTQSRHKNSILTTALMLTGIAAVAFLAGHRSPRYLYIMPYLMTPLAFFGWRHLGRPALMAVTVVALLGSLVSIEQLYLASQPKAKLSAIICSIESTHLSYGYSDFWDAYPITFLSGEQIIISPTIATSGGERTDRYRPYTAIVNSSPQAFALVPQDSPDLSDIKQLAGQVPIQFGLQRETLPGLDLYFPLNQDPLRRWLVSHGPP